MASSATLSGGTSSGSTSGKSPSRFITFGLLAIASAISLWFLWHYARPYFSWDPKAFDYYWPRRYRLIVHISGGVVALVCGTLQMWTGLRQKAMTFHRWAGRVYLVGVAVGIIGAFLMTRDTTPRVFGVGLMGLATAWLLTTGVAWAAIMRGQVALHKEWVTRSYLVTFAFVTFRVMTDHMPWLMTLVGSNDGEQSASVAWLCWTVPLAVYEVILQSRRLWRS